MISTILWVALSISDMDAIPSKLDAGISEKLDPELSKRVLYDAAKADARPILFASIPKSGSRSLKEIGMLGEVPGTCHSRIIEFPGYASYRWLAVYRDPEEWYDSFWRSCRRRPDAFTVAMGFEFKDRDADLARLSDPSVIRKLGKLPERLGLHAWVPDDFATAYADALDAGKSFKEYCFDYITSGVPCEVVKLPDLDSFQVSKGIAVPVHANVGIA